MRTRFSPVFVSMAFLVGAACGCGDDNQPTPDAAPTIDAMPADAAPVIDGTPADAAPPSPVGTWEVQSMATIAQTDDGGVAQVTIATTDTPVPVPTGGTQTTRVNGVLYLSAGGDVGAVGTFTTADRLAEAFLAPFLDGFTFGPSYSTIMTAHVGDAPIIWSDTSPDQLTLTTSADTTLLLQRYQHTASETITLAGQVSVGDDGVPGNLVPLLHPRAALVSLLRGPGGVTGFLQVPNSDFPLAGFGTTEAQTATFDLSRSEGALGVERIVFGTNAFLAVSLIIVYDDVNDDGNFDADAVTTSCGVGEDCIRGVSPVVLGYRVGTSQLLESSPFQYLLSGWTWAFVALDYRLGAPQPQLGLVSADPTTVAIPTDIVVPEDPANVVVPSLVF